MAANAAKTGDIITVFEGVHRNELTFLVAVNHSEPIIYHIPGENVKIKGSEIASGCEEKGTYGGFHMKITISVNLIPLQMKFVLIGFPLKEIAQLVLCISIIR